MASIVSDSFETANQAPLSMGFPRQEHWRGLSFPPPGDLPNAGMESMYPALADGFCITEPPGESGLGSNSETAVYMRGRGRTDSRREERTPHFCQVKKRKGQRGPRHEFGSQMAKLSPAWLRTTSFFSGHKPAKQYF